MKRKNELIIVIISILLVIFLSGTNVFGSSVDFLSQHVVFPDYLRNLFYSNGKFIPSLAINLGCGQNIFNIAYYGLLNPIILISYAFPYIKMIDYIVVVNVILFVLSNLFFYKFVSNKFDSFLSLMLTFLFMFSGPLVFHFHRHFMFVNYIPFLILALINIDKKRFIRLIVDVVLIFMTSFYFAIPSIFVIVIYYIYVNFDCISFKKFFKFLFYLVISILMSSILLLPTFYSIFSSRGSNVSDFLSLSLFIPNLNLDNILYGAYCVGLTGIGFISLIYLFYTKSKKNIFLGSSVSFLCFFPILLYLFNGGLYLRAKCLIPFLPLFIYMIGMFFNDLFSKKIDFKSFLYFTLFINLVVLLRYHVWAYYLDLFFMLLLIYLYNKFKSKNVILIPLVLFNFVFCILLNRTDNFVSYDYSDSLSENYKVNDFYRLSILNNIGDTVNRDYGNFLSSFYSSTNNSYYSDLYHNVFKVNNSSINNLSLNGTSNVLFNEYVGVKYVISDSVLGYPYSKIFDNLYFLDQTLPIGYVSNNYVNRDYYNSLSYPYNLDILLNYVISSDSNNMPTSKVKKVSLDYDYILGEYSSIVDGKLYVSENDSISVHINDDVDGKILFISINGQVVQDKDISMSINDQENILTKSNWTYPNNNYNFNYVLSGNDFIVEVSPGIYNVDDIETFILDNSFIDNIFVDPFKIDVMNSEIISGTIDVTRDGYFILKVPYDRGFEIKVNGKHIDYELANDSFIGFYLNKGFYNIEIKYNPPFLKTGIVFSCLGFVSFICLIVFRRCKK